MIEVKIEGHEIKKIVKGAEFEGKKNPRRLTPRECARIMGFPEKFKIPVSDNQAYRQFGCRRRSGVGGRRRRGGGRLIFWQRW